MRITKYVQAQRNILNLIASQGIGVNQLLPSEKELCRQFNLSMITVRRALDELAMQKIVARRPGKGTFVLKRLEEDASQGTVAFIATASVLYPAYIEFFDTLSHEMLKRGYQLKYLKGNSVPDEYILRELDGVAGVVLCGNMNPEWFDFLENNGINGVVIGSNPEKGRMPTVQYDWVNSAGMMVDYFVGCGCRKIGFINSSSGYLQGNIMQEGFDAAIERHGIQDTACSVRGNATTKIKDIATFLEAYEHDFEVLFVEGGYLPSLFFYYCENGIAPPRVGVFTEKIMEQIPLKRVVQTTFEENICSAATRTLFCLEENSSNETILIQPKLFMSKEE